MKKMNMISALMAMSLACMAFGFNAAAQDKKEKVKGEGMKEKMRAERVAFITHKVDLTSAEAEKFWPVYNEICRQRDEATAAEREAFRNLRETLKSGDDAAIAKAMKAYTDAADRNQRTLGKDAEKLSKVLPAAKVAKVLVAEEQFRRQQIHKAHNGKKPQAFHKGDKKHGVKAQPQDPAGQKAPKGPKEARHQHKAHKLPKVA